MLIVYHFIDYCLIVDQGAQVTAVAAFPINRDFLDDQRHALHILTTSLYGHRALVSMPPRSVDRDQRQRPIRVRFKWQCRFSAISRGPLRQASTAFIWAC